MTANANSGDRARRDAAAASDALDEFQSETPATVEPSRPGHATPTSSRLDQPRPPGRRTEPPRTGHGVPPPRPGPSARPPLRRDERQRFSEIDLTAPDRADAFPVARRPSRLAWVARLLVVLLLASGVLWVLERSARRGLVLQPPAPPGQTGVPVGEPDGRITSSDPLGARGALPPDTTIPPEVGSPGTVPPPEPDTAPPPVASIPDEPPPAPAREREARLPPQSQAPVRPPLSPPASQRIDPVVPPRPAPSQETSAAAAAELAPRPGNRTPRLEAPTQAAAPNVPVRQPPVGQAATRPAGQPDTAPEPLPEALPPPRPAAEPASEPAATAAALPPPAAPQPLPPAAAAAPAAAPATATADGAGITPPPIEVERSAIRDVLGRYGSAFSALDVGAARAIWPSVNEGDLARAFARLEQQEVSFDRCAIEIDGAQAEATCDGTARYIPRIGNRAPRREQRQWRFELSKSGEGWLIQNVRAR